MQDLVINNQILFHTKLTVWKHGHWYGNAYCNSTIIKIFQNSSDSSLEMYSNYKIYNYYRLTKGWVFQPYS